MSDITQHHDSKYKAFIQDVYIFFQSFETPSPMSAFPYFYLSESFRDFCHSKLPTSCMEGPIHILTQQQVKSNKSCLVVPDIMSSFINNDNKNMKIAY